MSRKTPDMWRWLCLALLVAVVGCSDDDDAQGIAGPDLPTGPGRVYPVQQVTFTTVDAIPVSAAFGRVPGTASRGPAVILIHDLGSVAGGDEWLLSGLFEQFLERGYLPLALDLRGHGSTPVPVDGRGAPQLLFSDLDDLHLDVRAALSWLKAQPSVDADRIAVIGNGAGGNVAYVSVGAFAADLKAGIALSPGLWESTTQEPLVIGAGIAPFAPHTMLYLAGADDILTVPGTGQTLSYAGFATALASLTQDPKTLTIYDGEAAHGLDLLRNPDIASQLFAWLAANL